MNMADNHSGSLTPSTTSIQSSQNDSGFALERIYNDQIIIITIRDSARETIDRWIDSINTIIESWPANKPVFAIQDFSQRKVGPTPYSRERAKEMTAKMATLKGYVAMVLPTTLVGHLIRIFYRSSSAVSVRRGKMQAKVFSDREKAIEWLKETVDLEAEKANVASTMK